MKLWANFFKGVILIVGIIVMAFDGLLYNAFEKQKKETETIRNQQQVDSQINGNKFKYQQDQIERLSRDLENAGQQIKEQNDALAQQKDESQSIRTSLVDIKAEADAIKQDVKGWQKDDVSVLAELEKKMDDAHDEIKSVKENLDSLNIPELKENINSLKTDIEKVTHSSDNGLSTAPVAPEAKAEGTQVGSQPQ